MDDVFSPIVRQFKKINVGEFRKVEDTGECINKPLEKLGINYKSILTKSDVQEIYKLSGTTIRNTVDMPHAFLPFST